MHSSAICGRLVLEPLGDEEVQQQIDDCLTGIRRRDIESQLKGLKEEMHAAERQGDMVRLAHLQRQFAELRRTLIHGLNRSSAPGTICRLRPCSTDLSNGDSSTMAGLRREV